MNTGESICADCGHELCMCDEIPLRPKLTTHAPLPATVVFYVSLVRHGAAGWAAGPCGTDYAYITSALRSYKSIDACRIYPVDLPVHTVPTI